LLANFGILVVSIDLEPGGRNGPFAEIAFIRLGIAEAFQQNRKGRMDGFAVLAHQSFPEFRDGAIQTTITMFETVDEIMCDFVFATMIERKCLS